MLDNLCVFGERVGGDLSPSSQAGLLPPSPLGTDREGLPSISSSLSNAPFRTWFHYCVAFTIRACSRRTFRYALFHLTADQISVSPENAPVYVAIPVICFFS
jgi:hypothetical protein